MANATTPPWLTRRSRIAALAALTLTPLAGCGTNEDSAATTKDASSPSPDAAPEQEFIQLEKEHGARLGVYALDTGSDEAIAYRADERFAFASTHKVFSVGALLQRKSMDELDEVVHYSEDDLLEYAPIAKKHVDEGMTLRQISDAAIRYSDNTAANLLFEELGGPSGLDAQLEKIGDDVTHVDRIEPDLNEWKPGEVRDTSTPEALTTSLRSYALGDTLPEEERAFIVDLMKRNTTGDNLIRAGVPDGWEVGDKTGSANYGTRNDFGIVWPPDGDPIVLAVLTSRDAEEAKHKEALLADATEIVVDELG